MERWHVLLRILLCKSDEMEYRLGSSYEMRRDGTMHSKSEYLKEGKWVPGHEVNYKEDPKAEVVFR